MIGRGFPPLLGWIYEIRFKCPVSLGPSLNMNKLHVYLEKKKQLVYTPTLYETGEFL